MAEPDDYRRYGDGLGETENFWIRDYENVLIFVFVFIIPVTLANLGFSHFYPESSYSIQSQLNDFHSLKRPKSALKVRLLVDLDLQKLRKVERIDFGALLKLQKLDFAFVQTTLLKKF